MSNGIKKVGKNAALALLSQVPVVSAFSKFVEDFVLDGWQERVDLWKKEVIRRLAQLDAGMEQRIRETTNFASILASAQRDALEDIEEGKVTLYANAVINAIKNEDIENIKRHIFLNILRDCTLLHIKVLKDISKSKAPITTISPECFNSENLLFHNLKMNYRDKDLLEAVMKDLSGYHLIYVVAGKIGATEPTIITDLGEEFLAFIAEQENAHGE